MRRTTTRVLMVRASIVAAAACGALFVQCTAKGPPRPTCNDVSDAGTSDAVAIIPYTTVTTDAQPPTTYGMEPDPGAQCVDCRQDDKYEIMTVSDFEDGFAPAWFNYGEPGILLEPPQAGQGVGADGMPNANSGPPPPYWGLQVATLGTRPGGERCGSKYALHMEGGRFTSWGGGYVTRHFITRGPYMRYVSPLGQNFCEDMRPPPNELLHGIGTAPNFMVQNDPDFGSVQTGCMFWASPVDQQPSLLGVDLSEFEGISFWTRRGPSGQATLRVALVDVNTSEDLALYREREKYIKEDIPPDQAGARCERIKSCCRNCYEGLEYEEYVSSIRQSSANPDAGTMPPAFVRPATADRCWVEGERLPHFGEDATGVIVAWDFRRAECGDEPQTPSDMVPHDPCWSTAASDIWDSWNRDFALCCPRTMEQEMADPYEKNGDPRYGGTPCSPYVFNFDYSSGSYCHNPGDVLPEANQNRCGESFEASVVVQPEWTLHTIPWAELRRFTPNKPPFDPRNVWQIAFYFGQGYLDTYLDDVGFYKRRPR